MGFVDIFAPDRFLVTGTFRPIYVRLVLIVLGPTQNPERVTPDIFGPPDVARACPEAWVENPQRQEAEAMK